MKNKQFAQRKKLLTEKYDQLRDRKNSKIEGNGIYERYTYPILTADHVPLLWRYDFNPETNPFFMERMGINAVFNAGAVLHENKVKLFCRVEGNDRKSFFAIATSNNGVDNFTFDPFPIALPQMDRMDTNVYDMRITQHQDGWIYGVFCTERKMPGVPESDTSSAEAQAGIIRAKDFKKWERLPDLETPSPQQRNCVLHPEFVDGNYAFYTRPQDGFIEAGSGGGIGWGLCADITNPVIHEEKVIDQRVYHTIKEVKNGQGPAPLKTTKGWLHLAHGVRNTAAGLRYVLYLFLSSLDDPSKIIKQPAGHFLAPQNDERVGDVSNVVFSNGWIARPDGQVLIYYASSDTRMHVAESSMDRLLDYVMNTPEDPCYSHLTVDQRIQLIKKNEPYV